MVARSSLGDAVVSPRTSLSTVSTHGSSSHTESDESQDQQEVDACHDFNNLSELELA